MKKILVLLVLSFSISCKPQNEKSADEVNVLFIGNSLTYYHDMPETLQNMLNETDPNFKIEQSTFPGMSLSGHLTNIITSRTENGISTRNKEAGEKTETEIKIAEKNWDIVILQTGTVSVLIPENRDLKTNKAIAEIKNLVSNPEAKFILFSTWPSKNEYPQKYCYSARFIDPSLEKEKYCSPEIEDLEQELKIINESYDLLAKENDLVKSNHGTKYYEVRTNYNQIDLYEDDSHPNEYGAFLNAGIFYQMLTNKKASDLNYTGEIEPEIAELLKQIAE